MDDFMKFYAKNEEKFCATGNKNDQFDPKREKAIASEIAAQKSKRPIKDPTPPVSDDNWSKRWHPEINSILRTYKTDPLYRDIKELDKEPNWKYVGDDDKNN